MLFEINFIYARKFKMRISFIYFVKQLKKICRVIWFDLVDNYKIDL